MKLNKEDLLLYAVTDRMWLNGRTLKEVVKESLDGGVTFLQLREKNLDDKHFLEEPGLVGVHPNDNTATVWLKTEDLIRIIEEHEHDVTLVSLD